MKTDLHVVHGCSLNVRCRKDRDGVQSRNESERASCAEKKTDGGKSPERIQKRGKRRYRRRREAGESAVEFQE